ncbi:uncharacterized protein TNCV_3015561 [Trichonephila clavipes]|nr:uncharacterized protein TNCV_3015561 [Trichonephila clavipes]
MIKQHHKWTCSLLPRIKQVGFYKRQHTYIEEKAENIIHGCRSSDVGNQELFRAFTSAELLLVMAMLDLTKSLGPDGIFGQMPENLGQLGKQRLVDLVNLSWKTGHLLADWKRVNIIPIKKAGKKT